MWPAMQSTKCSEDHACGTAWRGPATYLHGNSIPRRSTLWWTFSQISPSYEDRCLKDSFFTPIVAAVALQSRRCCVVVGVRIHCLFSRGLHVFRWHLTWPADLWSKISQWLGYFRSPFNGNFCWCRTVATAKRNEPVRLTEKCSVLLWNWCLI